MSFKAYHMMSLEHQSAFTVMRQQVLFSGVEGLPPLPPDLWICWRHKNQSCPRRQLSGLVLQAARHHLLIFSTRPAPLGIRASCRVQIQPALLQVYQTVRALPAPRSCLANSRVPVSAIGRSKASCTHASPERSLCWVLHGCPYSSTLRPLGGQLPKVSAHIFAQSLITKTSSQLNFKNDLCSWCLKCGYCTFFE